MPILRPHAMQTCESQKPSSVTLQQGHAGWFVQFLASGGAKLTKMEDSLPSTLMNRRAKFDAAIFILGGEIHDRTNKKHKQ